MQVIALIGDIVTSKAVARRAALQRKLEATLATVSAAAGPALASPYTLTLGDEFQAVYRAGGNVWADAVGILAAIHPVQARFALGVGELATKLNPKEALGMDGPAFHRARAGITALKEAGGRFTIAGDDPAAWALANGALALISHHLAGWSGNRLRVLAGLLRGRPVRELEAEVGISKVAVYKNINAAALDDIAGICGELTKALNAALTKDA
jgi:hypothetical protein